MRDPAAVISWGRGDERGRRKRPPRRGGRGAHREPATVELARYISRLAYDKKAEDVVILDLRKISSETDFFVIMSSLSDTHQRALADSIAEGMGEWGMREWHTEGYPSSAWILLDYVDVVVHIFRPETRRFYALESLWGDAPREVVREGGGEASAEDE